MLVCSWRQGIGFAHRKAAAMARHTIVIVGKENESS